MTDALARLSFMTMLDPAAQFCDALARAPTLVPDVLIALDFMRHTSVFRGHCPAQVWSVGWGSLDATKGQEHHRCRRCCEKDHGGTGRGCHIGEHAHLQHERTLHPQPPGSACPQHMSAPAENVRPANIMFPGVVP